MKQKKETDKGMQTGPDECASHPENFNYVNAVAMAGNFQSMFK